MVRILASVALILAIVGLCLRIIFTLVPMRPIVKRALLAVVALWFGLSLMQLAQ